MLQWSIFVPKCLSKSISSSVTLRVALHSKDYVMFMSVLPHMNIPTNTGVWSGKFGEWFPGAVYCEKVLTKQVSVTTIVTTIIVAM